MAINLSKNEKITNLLKLIEEFFENVKNGCGEIISKLRTVDAEDFIPIINARNSQGNTLLLVAIFYKHENISKPLLEMIKNFGKNEENVIVNDDKSFTFRQKIYNIFFQIFILFILYYLYYL